MPFISVPLKDAYTKHKTQSRSIADLAALFMIRSRLTDYLLLSSILAHLWVVRGIGIF